MSRPRRRSENVVNPQEFPPPQQQWDQWATAPIELPQAPRPHRRRTVLLLVIGAVLLVLAGGAGGFVIGKGQNASGVKSTTDTVAATSSTTTSATPTVYDIPIRPSDFEMNVEVLEKKCFGSAGCVVEFSVRPTLLTSSEFLKGRSFRVVYEVIGTEDEMTDYFTLSGTDMRIDDSLRAETESSDAEITAKVIKVTEE